MKKIVVTGGPQAGKSTMIDLAFKTAKKEKRNIFVLHETATQIISGGVEFHKNHYTFQRAILNLQIANEREVERAICGMIGADAAESAILLLDRGAIDGKAYLKENEWMNLCREVGVEEKELLLRYDGVIYLESVTKIDENGFSNESNPVRYETAAEAKVIDDNTYRVWLPHENLKVVKAKVNFDEKKENFFAVLENMIKQKELWFSN